MMRHCLAGRERILDSMQNSGPFDFTSAIRRLCEDIIERLPALSHVRMDQVAVAFAQTRRRVSHGLQAKLTPLRFERGELVSRRGGREWSIQRYFQGEVEILYILTFYMPRFQQHCFREKMITIVHELYHISETFDGDIRRFAGHYHVHSHSQDAYDAEMGKLVDEYLRRRPPPELTNFLHHSFDQLCGKFGGVVGLRVPIPKLILLAKSA